MPLIFSEPFSGDQVIFWANITHLSTPHPSGYIWQSLLAYFAQGLPTSFVMLTVQLTAALLSLICINRTLSTLKLPLLSQALIPFGWILSFGVLRYFIIYENKALAFLFINLYLFTMIRFLEKPSKKAKLFLFMSYVLACSQHHLMYVLLSPSLLYFVASTEPSKKKAFLKALLQTAIACILSFTPYLFLKFVTQSHLENLYSWGNIQSFSGLLTHWSRSEFGVLKLAEMPAPSYFKAVLNHASEIFLFLFKSTYGFVLVLLPFFNRVLPLSENHQRVFRLLALSLVIYYLFFIIFGSVNPTDSWYHALLVRFWILPSPFLFVLIALRLHQVFKKWAFLCWISLCVLLTSEITSLPAELQLAQNQNYHLFSEVIANESPEHSLVLHSSWIEWMRTTLIFNKQKPLTYTNPLNQSTHVSLKSLFQSGWPQEQFLSQLKREKILIQEGHQEELLSKFIKALHPQQILLVGFKEEQELKSFTNAFKYNSEAIGPYFLLTPQSNDEITDKNKIKTLRKKGVLLCAQLFKKLEDAPLDRWIEPVEDYFCYPCLQTYQMENLSLQNSWMSLCKTEQRVRL